MWRPNKKSGRTNPAAFQNLTILFSRVGFFRFGGRFFSSRLFSGGFSGLGGSLFNSGFFGSAVMEDEDFLKILEEFDYSGEEAVKALEFAVECMKYLMGGLL